MENSRETAVDEREEGEPKEAPPKQKKKKKSISPFAVYRNVIIRLFLLYKHVLGLIVGGFVSYVHSLPPYRKKGLRSVGLRIPAFFLKMFVKRDVRHKPFGVQLRRRLEMLGPTYIKLGQIMAIREDILPKHITDELKELLDQLPPIPFDAIRGIIEESLEKPLQELFKEIDEEAIGSASIGQIHRAVTHDGRPVVVKVIKPGIRETIMSDIKLLQILSNLLEWLIPRYQPKRILEEFGRYTMQEIDLTFEADNAEVFAANFKNNDDIIFPKILREYTTPDVMCMEYIEGLKPYDPEVMNFEKEDLDRVIDLGAGAIIKMIFEDGFFHADLHSGNVIILPGPKVGFIDVGIVGRFDERIKRSMFYYFYALISGDIESTAKYLLAMATVGKGGDPAEFKRSVSDLYRRYLIHASQGSFSLAQLVLHALAIAGKHHIFFPVEMTLMVKAMLTFEGVGLHLDPKLDIPKLSRKHIIAVYKRRYSPQRFFEQFKRGVPSMLDVLVRLPELIADSTRFWDESIYQRPPENPLAGLRSGIIAGACIIAAVLAYVQGAAPILWIALFLMGILLSLFGK